MTWKRITADLKPEPRALAEAALARIEAYCTSVTCRHASLVEHFGQAWDAGPCKACDVCLGKLKAADDALTTAQKIVSCVLRVRQQFAAGHIAKVLTGSRDKRVRQWAHDRLNTWGVLKDCRRYDVCQWIEQLVGQGFLVKEGEYQRLVVTKRGHQLLKGKATPTLLSAAKERRVMSSTSILDSWEGVDRGLFEELRDLRRTEAVARSVPAYIIFGDGTLRDMARRRPSTVERLLDVHGVGHQKASDFGPKFVGCIVRYCREHDVSLDVEPEFTPRRWRDPVPAEPSANALESFPLFDQGLGVEEVAGKLGRAVATTYNYLEEYIRHRRIADASRWIGPRVLQQLEVVVQYAGAERMRPIYDALHGRVGYGAIRIFLACWANRGGRFDPTTPAADNRKSPQHTEIAQ